MKARIDNDRESRDIEIKKEYSESLSNIAETATDVGEEKVYSLLAGYTDNDGITHDTFTLREMTGADEEYVNRSDIKSNGAKVSTALLARCVTSIGTLTRKSVGGPKEWEDIIKHLYVGDRDVMLLELRRLSIGEEIEVTHTCPNPDCKAKLNTVVNIDELEITEFNGIKEIPFELPKGFVDKKGNLHKTGVMRRPNGLDGELLTPIAKNNMAKAETALLTRLCKFDDGVYVDDSVMANLSVKDRNYLQKQLNDNFFGVNMSVDVMCDRCGESFKGNLNQTNFI
jgi:hypothetical protein